MTIFIWLGYLFFVLNLCVLAGITGWLVVKAALWCERNL